MGTLEAPIPVSQLDQIQNLQAHIFDPFNALDCSSMEEANLRTLLSPLGQLFRQVNN